MIDGILAAVVLLGPALNAALGWRWADPAAGSRQLLCSSMRVASLPQANPRTVPGGNVAAVLTIRMPRTLANQSGAAGPAPMAPANHSLQ